MFDLGYVQPGRKDLPVTRPMMRSTQTRCAADHAHAAWSADEMVAPDDRVSETPPVLSRTWAGQLEIRLRNGRPTREGRNEQKYAGRASVKGAVLLRRSAVSQRYPAWAGPYDRRGLLPASQNTGKSVSANGRDAAAGTGPEPTWLPLDPVLVASIEGVNPQIAIAVLPGGKRLCPRQGADVPAALASALRVRQR